VLAVVVEVSGAELDSPVVVDPSVVVGSDPPSSPPHDAATRPNAATRSRTG
jgi:hypothetical protein